MSSVVAPIEKLSMAKYSRCNKNFILIELKSCLPFEFLIISQVIVENLLVKNLRQLIQQLEEGNKFSQLL